jgi:hypothetical protein
VSSHELKCWPEFFQAIWDGDKAFELRRNDRGYAVRDMLLLREYDPDRDDLECGKRFTGRELTAEVVYILHGGRSQFGVEEGYVCMSIRVMQRSTTSSRFPKVSA